MDGLCLLGVKFFKWYVCDSYFRIKRSDINIRCFGDDILVKLFI